MHAVLLDRRAEIDALCRRLGVRRLDAFGSAVRGDFDPRSSDVNFLVEFESLPPPQYADAYFSLKDGLEALFGRPVDLVTASSVVNPYFRERMAASCETLYAA